MGSNPKFPEILYDKVFGYDFMVDADYKALRVRDMITVRVRDMIKVRVQDMIKVRVRDMIRVLEI